VEELKKEQEEQKKKELANSPALSLMELSSDEEDN
jgi:hypothetical protein